MEKSKDDVNIAIVADDRYANLVYVWAYSVAKYADNTRDYNLFIVSDRFSEANISSLRRYLVAFENCHVNYVDVSSVLDSISCDNTWNKESVVYYATLLLPNVLNDLHRCIYMDADMIAQRDLGELFDTDIGSNCLGAVSILGTSGRQYFAVQNYYCAVIGLDKPEDYFSNGVMLLDFDRIRSANALDIEKVKRTISQKDLLYADQDAINILMKGKVCYLCPNWNVGMVGDYSNIDDKYRIASLDPYVIHYNGPQKPTTSLEVKYSEAFWKIAREMDCYEKLWLNYIEVNFSLKNKIKAKKMRISRKIKNKILFWKHGNFRC